MLHFLKSLNISCKISQAFFNAVVKQVKNDVRLFIVRWVLTL